MVFRKSLPDPDYAVIPDSDTDTGSDPENPDTVQGREEGLLPPECCPGAGFRQLGHMRGDSNPSS
jgi:hypothetical protein